MAEQLLKRQIETGQGEQFKVDVYNRESLDIDTLKDLAVRYSTSFWAGPWKELLKDADSKQYGTVDINGQIYSDTLALMEFNQIETSDPQWSLIAWERAGENALVDLNGRPLGQFWTLDQATATLSQFIDSEDQGGYDGEIMVIRDKRNNIAGFTAYTVGKGKRGLTVCQKRFPYESLLLDKDEAASTTTTLDEFLLKHYGEDDYGVFLDFAISEEFQGQGLGSQLFDLRMNRLQEMGANVIVGRTIKTSPAQFFGNYFARGMLPIAYDPANPDKAIFAVKKEDMVSRFDGRNLAKLYLEQRPIILNELSKVVDPYTYILSLDIKAILERLVGSELQPGILNSFEQELAEIIQGIIPEGMRFMPVKTDRLYTKLGIRGAELSEVNDVLVVVAERYVSFPGQPDTARLDICRGKEELVSRAGVLDSPTEQIAQAVRLFRERNAKELVLIDDFLGRAGTALAITREIKKVAPEISVKWTFGTVVSGGNDWSGLQNLLQESGDIEFLTQVNAGDKTDSSSGTAYVSARDFTLLGGKVSGKNGGITYSSPYFLPFSFPKNALIPTDKLPELSIKLIDFNIRLFREINRSTARRLTFIDLIEKGFGLPALDEKFIGRLPTASLSEDIVTYLEEVKAELEVTYKNA